jgi:hypothetical protein
MAVEVIASRVACHVKSWQRAGIRRMCPGDPKWPSQLEAPGDAHSWGLTASRSIPGTGTKYRRTFSCDAK